MESNRLSESFDTTTTTIHNNSSDDDDADTADINTNIAAKQTLLFNTFGNVNCSSRSSSRLNLYKHHWWLLPLMIVFDADYLKYTKCSDIYNVYVNTTTKDHDHDTAAVADDNNNNTHDDDDNTENRNLKTSILYIDGQAYNEHSMAIHMWTTEKFEINLYEILRNNIVNKLDSLLFGEYSTACWALHLIEYNFNNFKSKYLVQQVLNCYNCEPFKFYIQIDACRVSVEPVFCK